MDRKFPNRLGAAEGKASAVQRFFGRNQLIYRDFPYERGITKFHVSKISLGKSYWHWDLTAGQ
jgi:hypothetical protein